jgi:protein-tyrosine-phosphatase
MPRKKRVLFVCTANAARSQMAEALLRRLRPDIYEVFSAGTAPTEVDPRALRALEHFDVDPSGLHSKPLEQFRDQKFDYVIALCKKSEAECQTVQCNGEYIAWDFEDPQVAGTPNAFVKTLNEIQQRIQMFLLVTEKE